jgi:hypothetical protein
MGPLGEERDVPTCDRSRRPAPSTSAVTEQHETSTLRALERVPRPTTSHLEPGAATDLGEVTSRTRSDPVVTTTAASAHAAGSSHTITSTTARSRRPMIERVVENPPVTSPIESSAVTESR